MHAVNQVGGRVGKSVTCMFFFWICCQCKFVFYPYLSLSTKRIHILPNRVQYILTLMAMMKANIYLLLFLNATVYYLVLQLVLSVRIMKYLHSGANFLKARY